jgi:hypothetical protein
MEAPVRLRRWRCRWPGRATGHGALAEDLPEGAVQQLELVEWDGEPQERALARATARGDAQGWTGACRRVGPQRSRERAQACTPRGRKASKRVDRGPAPGGGTTYLVRGAERERHEDHSLVPFDVDHQTLEGRRGCDGGLEGDHAKAEVALEEAMDAHELTRKLAGDLPALAGGAGGQSV